jgi:hypothetical protein
MRSAVVEGAFWHRLGALASAAREEFSQLRELCDLLSGFTGEPSQVVCNMRLEPFGTLQVTVGDLRTLNADTLSTPVCAGIVVDGC